MKNAATFILVLAITLTSAFANEDLKQNIRGTVVDAITGFPLIGANVVLVNSDPVKGTVTDLNGNFALTEIPVGRQSIAISYIGYHNRVIENLLLTSGKEVVLNITLEEKAIEVGEVVISAGKKRKDEAQNEMAIISARTFSVEETERFAGSLGDPARMVANYAGVMTQNDSRNDIIIRGNSPMGVLWRLEGVEIPNPNHFGALGTTGGPVSMVNNNLLTNSDFLTGAFPAEFGNATAGAFDLNMRSGNNNKTEFTGQIGFNGFEGGVEGPFMSIGNQKATYLANFRYSTLAVMDKIGFSFGTGDAIPQYKDLTFLIDLPGTKLGRFKVFGLLGNSYIELGREKADTTSNSYNAKGTATDFGSGLGVVGLANTYYFNEKTRLKSTLSYQRTDAYTRLDSVKNAGDLFVPFVRQNQAEYKLSFSTQFRQKINSRNNYSIGLIVDRYNIDYKDSINHSDYDHFITYASITGGMMMYRAYGQWQHKFNDQLMAYSGLHMQLFGLNQELAVEPRLGLKWQFSERQSVNAGFGMHSQIQPKSVYYYETYLEDDNTYFRTNENIRSSRSNHFVIGYDRLINSHFRVKMESYYQQLYNIPVKETFPEFSLANAGDFFGVPQEDSLVNDGKGKNYGVELTVEKFLSKGYYFLFTASLFDSKYTGYDGVWRNTAFNGNYVFNLLGGYEHKLGPKTMITLDLKTVLAGGRRYVPVDEAASILEGSDVRDWSRAYEEKYSDYFRTDLRIGIKKNGKRVSQEWGIDLQNITGYQSVFMETWDAGNGEMETVYQQGFMPMFLWRIQF